MSKIVTNPKGQLYKQEHTVVVAASTLTSDEFTLTKGRGDVQAWSMDASSTAATSNEIQQANVTAGPNGVEAIQESNAKQYSDFNNKSETGIIYPQCIPAGSTFNYTIDNQNNPNELVVTFVLYYYYPFQEINLKEGMC